jgi:hypothetical protein
VWPWRGAVRPACASIISPSRVPLSTQLGVPGFRLCRRKATREREDNKALVVDQQAVDVVVARRRHRLPSLVRCLCREQVPSRNVLRTAVTSVEQHLNPRFCLERRMRLLCLQLQLKPNGTGARRMTDGDEPVKWGHFFFISFS